MRGTSFLRSSAVPLLSIALLLLIAPSAAAALPSADLGITATASPAEAKNGETIVFTITVTNIGTRDGGARVLLIPSQGLQPLELLQSAPPYFDCPNGIVQSFCSVASFVPGRTHVFTLITRVHPLATGIASLYVAVEALRGDEDLFRGNNSMLVPITVTPVADLSVAVVDEGKSPPNGTQVVFTVTVASTGPANSSEVTFTDDVPQDATFVRLDQTAAREFTCTTPPAGATGTIRCTVPSFSINLTRSFGIYVNSTSRRATLTNTATVSSATFDPNLTNNTSTGLALVPLFIPTLSPAMLALMTLVLIAVGAVSLRN